MTQYIVPELVVIVVSLFSWDEPPTRRHCPGIAYLAADQKL